MRDGLIMVAREYGAYLKIRYETDGGQLPHVDGRLVDRWWTGGSR